MINQNHARFIEYRANKYMPKHQKISIVSDLYTTEAVMVNSTQVIVEGFESILDLYWTNTEYYNRTNEYTT